LRLDCSLKSQSDNINETLRLKHSRLESQSNDNNNETLRLEPSRLESQSNDNYNTLRLERLLKSQSLTNKISLTLRLECSRLESQSLKVIIIIIAQVSKSN